MSLLLDKYNEIIEYEFHDEFKYADKIENSKSFKITHEAFVDKLKNHKSTLAEWDFPWLYEISIYYYEFSLYAKLHLKDEILSEKYLSLSTSYASLSLDMSAQSCGCYKDGNPFIIINKSVFMMSVILLVREMKEFNTIGKQLIDSLNGKGCIVKRGYAKATVSWFVLKLYSLYSNEKITLNKLLQPKDTYGYSKILENWDTTDTKEILLYIETLCEIHITQAQKDDDIYLKVKDDPDDLTYRELFLVSSYYFPYEILTWLKLRELKGLKNPKTFTHPLMNTPIAKMFLNIKEPLPKPKELPYAKELLEKLKEQCPDVEIPEWLDGSSSDSTTHENAEETKEENDNKDNNIIPDDFFVQE